MIKILEDNSLKNMSIFKQMVENVNDVIVLTKNNTILYANPQFYKILGYNKEEIVGIN